MTGMQKLSDSDSQIGPQTPRHLFLAFSLLSLQGFGGLIAVIQRELVEKRKWLTLEQFLSDWAVAQTLPGPNVINLAIIFGERRFGFRGALAAVAGLLTAPLLILLTVAKLTQGANENQAVEGALRGMGVMAGALVAGSGLRMLSGLRKNLLSRSACTVLGTATFLAVGVFQMPVPITMLGLGGLGSLWALTRSVRPKRS